MTTPAAPSNLPAVPKDALRAALGAAWGKAGSRGARALAAGLTGLSTALISAHAPNVVKPLADWANSPNGIALTTIGFTVGLNMGFAELRERYGNELLKDANGQPVLDPATAQPKLTLRARLIRWAPF